MQTSSSAKRTCSDSRSASLYTATVEIPSSRHARITRRAISPRFAIKTFLNIRSAAGFAAAAHLREGAVRRPLDPAEPEGELAGVGGEEERHFVADRALVIPLHQRLVEG